MNMAVSEETSAIAQIKLSQLLDRSRTSRIEVEQFQEWIFEGGKAISEAVNKRHRSFDNVLKVAAAAQNFEEWVKEVPEDRDLRKEYLRSIQKLDGIDKLPAQPLCWFLFTIAGGFIENLQPPLCTIASTTLGAADALLFEKLVKGWKPNQFVQGPLQSFVEGGSK